MPASATNEKWGWAQSSTLKYQFKVNKTAAGGYMFTLKAWETTAVASAVSLSIVDAGGQTVSGPTSYSIQHDARPVGTCTASFHIKCQERYARHAHRNAIEDNEYIFYNSSVFKLELADPQPDCWKADSSSTPLSVFDCPESALDGPR